MQLLPQSIRHEQRGSVCFLPLSRELGHGSSFEITASRPCAHRALQAGVRIAQRGSWLPTVVRGKYLTERIKYGTWTKDMYKI